MEKIEREKLITKIICITLAVILWFYVSYYENPIMTKTVRNVPVKVNNEQTETLRERGLSVYSLSEEKVDVGVSTQRLNLSKVTNKSLSAYVNVSSIEKSGTYYLPAIVLCDVNVNATYYVKSDNIKVVVEPIISGTFNVEPDIESTYVAYDTFELDTEKIVISAPESIFNKIGTVKTKTIKLDNETESVTKELVIYDKEENPIDSKSMVCTPKKVDVKFKYLSKKTVQVALKTAKGNKHTLPAENNIVIYGKPDVLSEISQISTIEINLSPYEENSEVKLKLDLPEGIRVKDSDREISVVLNSTYFK